MLFRCPRHPDHGDSVPEVLEHILLHLIHIEEHMATKDDVNAAIKSISDKVATAATAASQEIADVNAKIQSLIDAGTGTISAADAQSFIDQLTPVGESLDKLAADLQTEDTSVNPAPQAPPTTGNASQ
jgi:hypothetical protein